MSKTSLVTVKVLRSHPDFSTHPGEVLDLSRETFDKYAEKGPFFEEITAKEAARAHAATPAVETAAAPAVGEMAVPPAAGVKTAADAAKAVEKATHSTAKAAPAALLGLKSIAKSTDK